MLLEMLSGREYCSTQINNHFYFYLNKLCFLLKDINIGEIRHCCIKYCETFLPLVL